MRLIRTLAALLVVLLPACSRPTAQQSVNAGTAPARFAQPDPRQAPADAQGHYVIEGDAVAFEQTGEVVLSRVGEGGAPAEEHLARATLAQGKFRIEGTVDWIGMATLFVEAPGDSGISLGTRIGFADIVLEPGTTHVVLRPANKGRLDTLHGGKYSQALIESWLNDPAYIAASKEADALASVGYGEQDPEEKIRAAEERSYTDKANEIRADRLSPLLKSPDPLLRFLALGNAPDLQQLTVLQQEMPGYPGVARAIAGIHGEQKRVAAAATVAPGRTISDFTAQDIDGHAFHLSEVFKQHRYVLVDFWASWCGPCREEIPQMKKAYRTFHAKGFEIVSFSLDDKHKSWRKASEEEKLPWINTGDLQAFSSPVSQLFGLRTIPANFLVDDKGKIVAMSLRGADLEKTLATLLGS